MTKIEPEKYVGDFEDPRAANRLLLIHLRKLIRYYQANPITDPSDVGLAARTLVKVVIESPCVPIESYEDWIGCRYKCMKTAC